MGLEVRGQARVWGRSMMSKEGKERKSPAKEEVWRPMAMQGGGGAAIWYI